MLKKLKNWMAIAILAVATCLNCGVASANSTVEMEEDEFFYECDSITWSNSGSKVTVEGTFYNLSSDCDVVALEDIVFGLYDGNDDLLFTVDADTSFIEVIPHESSYTYTFWVDDINDIPQKSKKNNSVYIEDGSYSYNACEGRNCSYCALADESNSNNRKSTNNNTSNSDDYDYWMTCSTCKGTGNCKQCDGTGRRSNGRMCTTCNGTGECSTCEGLGERKLILVNGKEYVVCGSCHGSTICKFCDGTGKSGYYGSLGQLSCYSCKGKGICGICGGKGYTR